jgi:hypothetical protein
MFSAAILVGIIVQFDANWCFVSGVIEQSDINRNYISTDIIGVSSQIKVRVLISCYKLTTQCFRFLSPGINMINKLPTCNIMLKAVKLVQLFLH